MSCLSKHAKKKSLYKFLKKTLLKKHEITKLQSTVNNLPTYFYANNNLYSNNFPSKISRYMYLPI